MTSLPTWTRRASLKFGIAATVTAITPEVALASSPGEVADPPVSHQPAPTDASLASLRERLLLDLNSRFRLGNAGDAERNFDFGKLAREAIFAKSGRASAVTYMKFDDSAW